MRQKPKREMRTPKEGHRTYYKDLSMLYWFYPCPKEWECAYLIPFSDFHIGSPQFEEKKLRGYFKWVADTENALCMFVGDLVNVGLPGTVDTDWWDQDPLTPQDQVLELVQMVEEYDLKDKIIAIVGGSNHPGRARKLTGHDYDYDFAHELGLESIYGRDGVAVKVSVGHWSGAKDEATGTVRSGKDQVQYIIYGTHGWAGGRMAGGAMNAVRELGAIINADVYVAAHRHLDAATRDQFIDFNLRYPRIAVKRRYYITSGSFLGWGGYAQAKGLRPCGTGTPRIRLDGHKKDVHVSV